MWCALFESDDRHYTPGALLANAITHYLTFLHTHTTGQPAHFRLLYRYDAGGDPHSDHRVLDLQFHEYCDGLRPTLTLIRARAPGDGPSFLFGGYTPSSWISNYGAPSTTPFTTFLFAITSPQVPRTQRPPSCLHLRHLLPCPLRTLLWDQRGHWAFNRTRQHHFRRRIRTRILPRHTQQGSSWST